MKTNLPLALAAFALTSAPLQAETALERVLSLLESNPDLVLGNVYLNISRNSPVDVAGAVSSVDSSVYYYEAPPEPDAEAPDPLKLDVNTTAVGATNTGSINSIESQSLGNAGKAPDNLLAFTANSAVTEGQVFASVSMDTNTPRAESSEISTSAIGAMNTGTIQIVIKDSEGN